MERERQKQTRCARTNDRTVDSRRGGETDRKIDKESGGENGGKGKRNKEAENEWRTPSYRSIRTPISPPGRAITAYREWDESHPKRMGWMVG